MHASNPPLLVAIATFTQLLEAHERSVASGKPLMSDEGLCFIRQALVSIRSHGTESVFPPRLLLPYWDTDRRQFWLGNTLLKEYSQPASNQIAVLTAFRSIGWAARRIEDPLPAISRELPGEARLRLRETVKNLNRGIPKGTIHFWLEPDNDGVRWDFCGGGSSKDTCLDAFFEEVEEL